MRIVTAILLISLCLSLSCGGSSETETVSNSILPDSAQTQAIEHTSPQDAITGAYNLIDEAQSVTDQANARTDELEQLMGDR